MQFLNEKKVQNIAEAKLYRSETVSHKNKTKFEWIESNIHKSFLILNIVLKMTFQTENIPPPPHLINTAENGQWVVFVYLF